jgi:hypothetical protein
MNNAEREFFISRICAGYVRCPVMDHNFKIYPIDDSKSYESNELVMEIMESSCGLTEDEVLFFMTDHDEWTLTQENRYKELPEKIEDIKVDMYNATFKSNLRETLRTELNKLRAEYETLSSGRSKYNYLTTFGIALTAKSHYIIEQCTYLDGQQYNWEKVPITAVMAKYNSLLLDDGQLRELARTEPWSSVWAIKKANGKIFEEPFSFEQKQLILYSRFYDGIQEAHERPSQEVIEDDDLLDGWLISNRRKHANTTTENFTTNPKIAGADEVFIIAETPKDIEKINNMNDAHAKSVKKRRLKTLEGKKDMSWLEFADMKERIGIEKTRLMMGKHK